MLSLLWMLAACAPPPYTPADSGPVDDGLPSIAFTWPLPETSWTGCVVATVDIKNFDLITPVPDMPVVPGQGHWHVLHPDGPSGYDLCDKPYCVAHFEEMEGGPVNAFLTAALAGNDHQPIYDGNGDPIEVTMPLTFNAGACEEGLGSEAYDTGAGDTGAGDTGAGDTGDTGADSGA